jgi:two-component system, sensor histidine kinase RpfC
MPLAMTAIPRLLHRWHNISADGEQQMAMNRLIISILALSFNLWAKPRGLMSGLPVLAASLYLLFGCMSTLHLLARPTPSFVRRMASLTVDIFGACYELHIGGASTVWLFSGYLWIIFGNGFRFGSRFQVYAMALATVGFCAMAAITPYWRSQPAQLLGGIVSLTVVPLYALALINRLSRARRQAEEASRAKSLFLASVSHELRTPLNAVIGMGALLESTTLDHDQMQMSQTITTAARSLLSLIDGILDLSQAEAGRMSIARSDFDLAQLLNEIKIIFLAQGRLKGVEVTVHATGRTNFLLHGDARKLHEILLNLAGNAMKFTESGHITVGVDMVAQEDDQMRLRCEVTDTGIGIAAEAHERIFDVFSQADGTIVNRFGGTGLGLALVRKSVQFLGGEIGVKSAPGAGSTFWFELPMQRQPDMAEAGKPFTHLRALVLARRADVVAPLLGRLTDLGVHVARVEAALPDWPVPAPSSACVLAFERVTPDAPQRPFKGASGANALSFVDVGAWEAGGLPDAATQHRFTSLLQLPVTDAELRGTLHFLSTVMDHESRPAAKAPRPAPRENFSLLVADDIATNRSVMEMILRSAGHTVTLVGNGEEALDALAEHVFDAALLDVNMPVMDGIEAAKIYRMTTLGAPTVPLIALTADATSETHDRCLAAGMMACVAKPVEPTRLLAMLDEAIGQMRSSQARAAALIHPHPASDPALPRLRSNLPPAVEAEVVESLRVLGGEDFMRDVIDLFRSEARTKLRGLYTAAAQGNVTEFRTQAHALRSVAANVGARQLSEICLPFQTASSAELRQRSPAWLEQIETELNRVEAALAKYFSDEAVNVRH